MFRHRREWERPTRTGKEFGFRTGLVPFNSKNSCHTLSLGRPWPPSSALLLEEADWASQPQCCAQCCGVQLSSWKVAHTPRWQHRVFLVFGFFATDRSLMKVSVYLLSTTHRALSLMQLGDDKPIGAEGERQHQETSPSQMDVKVGPHEDRVRTEPMNSWNFRVVFLDYRRTSGAILSKPSVTSPVCQLSADLRQLSGHVSVTSSPK